MARKKKKVKDKLWGGRFREALSDAAEIFTSSVDFDKKLYHHDIIGSIAYSNALMKAHVISQKECKRIIKGLTAILKGIKSGKIQFRTEFEDVHMNIEALLIDMIGDTGKKLHTGRSRNDQVATDLRMYLKDEIAATIPLISKFQATLVELAEKHIKVIMPGYTHLQRAQPVLLSHHLMAYYTMLDRDKERIFETYRRTDVMPLGSGALAGTNFKIDRKFLADVLSFSEISKNSVDAVSDRDFVLDYLSAAAILMMHLSRMCEELVIWSSYEFSFIELSDQYSTGSSIMPQKKNPDVAELIRGKSGRVYGNLMSLLTVMKGLPLAYNRDTQEDKEPLFDTIETVQASLKLMTEMLATAKFNDKEMLDAARKGFLTATDLAFYLVNKGVPFRKAHEIVGKIIAYCEDANMQLDYLSVQELKKFSDRFSFDAQKIISTESSIASKDIYGGTATVRVKEQIKIARKKLTKVKEKE
ncbi:MAG: argininosuccinate lyase [Candidatus Margulisbacteria bacterium]|nr:argininosuccinate lyase [Candidatus Margulisiibacteriota bacterium]MBU1022469.1 argininosuccinate lyase [Candidatus Margulisiibacteriota bacterium]MBU1728453.1 argininosuccinate lyase [Candidatus Margulisiibacteriota bacterium]MBU1954600.1 argininosuccinate lyase [Candidatus Margulisiibacteriota bacterium]